MQDVYSNENQILNLNKKKKKKNKSNLSVNNNNNNVVVTENANSNDLQIETNKPAETTVTGSSSTSFIKTHPVIFSLIIVGCVVVVAAGVIIPIIIIKKNKDDKKNVTPKNNENKDLQIMDLTLAENSTVDNILSNIGNNDKNTLGEFCTYLAGKTTNLNERQKTLIAYKYVAQNIKYDAYNFKHDKDKIERDPEIFFSSKTTVCSGYARLFTKLLVSMSGFTQDVNVANIIGFSKGSSYNPSVALTEPDHEWSAVKINNTWCLIDTTWGAGNIDGDNFIKNYKEDYLCTPPIQFIRTHLPQDSQKFYQLLDSPFTITKFQEIADVTNTFFNYGFTNIIEDKRIQNICGLGTIVLQYNTNESLELLLSIKKGGVEITNMLYPKIIKNGFEINLSVNEVAEYSLLIYSKKKMMKIILK